VPTAEPQRTTAAHLILPVGAAPASACTVASAVSERAPLAAVSWKR